MVTYVKIKTNQKNHQAIKKYFFFNYKFQLFFSLLNQAFNIILLYSSLKMIMKFYYSKFSNDFRF